MFRTLRRYVGIALILGVCALGSTSVQAQTKFVGMGDSIGEGVQSANASVWSQPFTYLNLIALRMGAPFPLPYIQTGLFDIIGQIGSRFRVFPTEAGLNLAVSGADVNSLRFDAANAATTAAIDTETDLVLFPRLGSQMDVAQSLLPATIACWIGNNDALAAVTAFDHLDVSQLTSTADFTTDFTAIAAQFKNMHAKVVFGTIPDVSKIGFLVDRNDLIKFVGSDFGLPATSRTTVVTMILIKIGLLPPTVLQDPNYVLDANEQAIISQRIAQFNVIIRTVAQANGMGVASIDTRFNQFATTPPTFYGIPLTNKFLGGLFSLDGVHPSNIAHALVANEFIGAFNTTYGMSIPPLDTDILNYFFYTDPFVDLNGNGVVRGRPLSGLLELLSWALGISGDSESFGMTAIAATATTDSKPSNTGQDKKDPAKAFMDEYKRATGKDLTKASRQEILDAFRQLYGLDRFKKKPRKG